LQMKALSMMSNWVGGAYVRREHKGDNGNKPPLEAVPVAVQRDALKWIVDSTFKDEAFHLNAAMLQRLPTDNLVGDESFNSEESTYPLHDRIVGVQGSVLTMLLNPTRL